MKNQKTRGTMPAGGGVVKKRAHEFDFDCECLACDRAAKRAFRQFVRRGMSPYVRNALHEILAATVDNKNRKAAATRGAERAS
jgi:hypothetical protein